MIDNNTLASDRLGYSLMIANYSQKVLLFLFCYFDIGLPSIGQDRRAWVTFLFLSLSLDT